MKIFHTPLGQTAQATKQAKVLHTIMEPEWTVNIVFNLTNSSLLSISNFADANYLTIFTPQDIQILTDSKQKW